MRLGLVLGLDSLDAEDDGIVGDSFEALEVGEGFAEEAEGCFVEEEDDVDEFGVGVVWVGGRVCS